jgi:hypothetical protein
MVAVGGTISLTRPRIQNPHSKNSQTIQTEFMPPEQNLGHALKGIVFSKEVNVPYGESPIILHCYCYWIDRSLKLDIQTAYGETSIFFRAENQSEKDVY